MAVIRRRSAPIAEQLGSNKILGSESNVIQLTFNTQSHILRRRQYAGFRPFAIGWEIVGNQGTNLWISLCIRCVVCNTIQYGVVVVPETQMQVHDFIRVLKTSDMKLNEITQIIQQSRHYAALHNRCQCLHDGADIGVSVWALASL